MRGRVLKTSRSKVVDLCSLSESDLWEVAAWVVETQIEPIIGNLTFTSEASARILESIGAGLERKPGSLRL